MTDDLAVDDCEPAVFFLLHLSECCCDLSELSLSAMLSVQDPLLVVALDRSICP